MPTKLTKPLIDKASLTEEPHWEVGQDGKERLSSSLREATGSTYVIYDTKLPGFGVRVGATKKMFIVQKRFGAKIVKRIVGRYGEIDVDSARQRAREMLLMIWKGEDPQAEREKKKQAQKWTIERLLDDYVVAKRLQPRTVEDINHAKSLLKAWLPRQVDEFTTGKAVALFQELSRHGEITAAEYLKNNGIRAKTAEDIADAKIRARYESLQKRGGSQANRVFRYLRAAFQYHVDVHHDGMRANPVRVLSLQNLWNPTEPRDHTISLETDEIKRWLNAVIDYRAKHPTASDYLLLCILFGTRRRELARLRWEDVNFDENSLTLRKTKSGEDHTIPIGRVAGRILEKRRDENQEIGAPWVFHSRNIDNATGEHMHLVSPGKHLKVITELSRVVFTMHDLRRTFATTLNNKLRVSSITLAFAMNHAKKSNVTQQYVREKLEALREPLQEYEDYLLRFADREPLQG